MNVATEVSGFRFSQKSSIVCLFLFFFSYGAKQNIHCDKHEMRIKYNNLLDVTCALPTFIGMTYTQMQNTH